MRLNAAGSTPELSLSGTLTNARLAQLSPALGAAADAPVDLRFDLRGRGASPRAAAASTSGAIAVRLGPGRLERRKAAALGGDFLQAATLSLGGAPGRGARLLCAAADFSARAGQLRVSRLTVVTDIGTTRGEGAIDLGAERLALALHGQPTGRRLFRTDVPVRVEGPLAHPATSVARGSALKSAGLALLAAPLQAVLPFAGSSSPAADCATLGAAPGRTGRPAT